MVLINFLIGAFFLLFLSFFFYKIEDKKNDAILIYFLWFLISIIVYFFLEQEIWLWTGIWLFAILSLLSFRRKFSSKTLLFFFISITIWLLSVLVNDCLMLLFINSLIILILILLELIFKDTSKIEVKILLENLSELDSKVTLKLWNMFFKYKKYNIKKIEEKEDWYEIELYIII